MVNLRKVVYWVTLLVIFSIIFNSNVAGTTPKVFQDLYILNEPEVMYKGKENAQARFFVKQLGDSLLIFSAPSAGYQILMTIPGLPGFIATGTGEQIQPARLFGILKPIEKAKQEELDVIINRENGAEHSFLGKVKPGAGYTINSDQKYPLTFKVVANIGYVRLCGRGEVITNKGKVYSFGKKDTIDIWLPKLKSKYTLTREAATQALGWLAKSKTEIEKTLPNLKLALSDQAMNVRRNAAEALGRIGDKKALEWLKNAKVNEQDKDVKAVIEEVITNLEK